MPGFAGGEGAVLRIDFFMEDLNRSDEKCILLRLAEIRDNDGSLFFMDVWIRFNEIAIERS